MEQHQNTVFVYGTLKQGFPLHGALDGKAAFISEGWLKDHVLFSLGPFPGVQPGDGTVRGELWEVTPQNLLALDRVEGEGSLYDRRRVWVGLDEESQTSIMAWVYIYRGQPGPVIESGSWEAHHVMR